jgi:hypothetical protein
MRIPTIPRQSDTRSRARPTLRVRDNGAEAIEARISDENKLQPPSQAGARDVSMTTEHKRALVLTLGLGIVALAWVVVAAEVVPPLVERAYRGERLAVLTELFAGHRSRYDLFDRFWLRYNWTLLALLVVMGLALIAATIPEVQRYIDARAGRAPPLQVTLLLRATRARFLRIFIGFLVAASLLSIGTGVEVWPFSPYPMYADIQGPTTSQSRVVVVTEQGESDPRHGRWLAPVDAVRLGVALERLRRREDRAAGFRSVADFVLERYNSLRHRPMPANAAIGVRIYRATWVLEPWARNRNHPDTLTMMFEWKQPHGR